MFFPWPPDDWFADWERRFELEPGCLWASLWHRDDIEAANVGAMSGEEFAARCAARMGVDEAHVRELIETAFYGAEPDPDLVAYTRSLRPRYRVAALTNTWSFGRRLLEARGFAELFDPIICSAEEGVCKPDPRIYRIALDRLGLQPAEVVFVDDAEPNVAAARDLGLRAIRFLSPERTIAKLDRWLTSAG